MNVHPRSKPVWILSLAITVLALADGLIHFLLDFVLFGGNFIGSGPPPGPPPGPPAGAAYAGAPPPGPAPMPLPLPLNELFLLNAIGYVGLVIIFWISPRWLGWWSWLADAVLIVYTVASIAGWLMVGRPNPNGLGYLSKAIEVVLIVLLVVHASTTFRGRDGARAALSRGQPAA